MATYGECIVIFVQNLVLIALLWKYNKTASGERFVVAFGYAAIAYGLYQLLPSERR